LFWRNKNNLPVIGLRRSSGQFFPIAVDDNDDVDVVDEQKNGSRCEGQVAWNDCGLAEISLNNDLKSFFTNSIL